MISLAITNAYINYVHCELSDKNILNLIISLALIYRRFHGGGRHLGSGAKAAKFTMNVWEKS